MAQETETGTANEPRKVPKIDWNDKSYANWIHAGKSGMDFKGFDFQRDNVIRFMNRIDLNSGPLKQKIEMMIRVKVPEVDDNGEEVGPIKEYVYYTIRYEGRDSWKQKIACDLIEGRHQIIVQEQRVDWKLEDGHPIQDITTVDSTPVLKYTILFEGKKTVDAILKKHNMIERENDIRFYWKARGTYPGAGGDRCTDYSYDQFSNSEFSHLEYLARRPGGPTGKINLAKETPAYAECTCGACVKQK